MDAWRRGHTVNNKNYYILLVLTMLTVVFLDDKQALRYDME